MKNKLTKKIVSYVIASTILGALAIGTVTAVDTACQRYQYGKSTVGFFRKDEIKVQK